MTEKKNKTNEKKKYNTAMKIGAAFAITLMVMLPGSIAEQGTITLSTNPVITSNQQQNQIQNPSEDCCSISENEEETTQKTALDTETQEIGDTRISFNGWEGGNGNSHGERKTIVNMSGAKVINMTDWEPVPGANITLTCEHQCEGAGTTESTTATTDGHGIAHDLVWETHTDCDPFEEQGQCGMEIKHDEDFRDFEIEMGSIKWNYTTIRWDTSIPNRAGATSVAEISDITSRALSEMEQPGQIEQLTYAMEDLDHLPAQIAVGAVILMPAILASILGSVICWLFDLIEDEINDFLEMALEDPPTISIPCPWREHEDDPAIYEDPEDMEYPKKNNVFALEPDKEIDVSLFDTGEMLAFGGRVSEFLKANPVIGRPREMNKEQLNQWLINKGQNLGSGEKISHLVHVTDEGVNCLIDPDYPQNPGRDDAGIRWEKETLHGEEYGKDMIIHQNQTYLFTIEGGGTEDSDFTVRSTRITSIPGPIYTQRTFQLEDLHGVCISDEQSEIEEGRVMNHQTVPASTLSQGDTYTPSPHYANLEDKGAEKVQTIGEEGENTVKVDLYCAPGDSHKDVKRDEHGDDEERPDSLLIREDLWNGLVGRVYATPEEASSEKEQIPEYNGPECGKIEVELDCRNILPGIIDYLCKLGYVDDILTQSDTLRCPEGFRCVDEDEHICEMRDPVEKKCRVSGENALYNMVPCEEGIEAEDLQDLSRAGKLELERAPRQFNCVERAGEADNSGKACPIGSPYYPEADKCVINTLTE